MLPTLNAAAPGQPYTVSSEGSTAPIENPLVLNGTSFIATNIGTVPVHVRATHDGEGEEGIGLGEPGWNYPCIPPETSAILRKRSFDTHLAMTTAEGSDGTAKVLIAPVID